MPAAPLLRSECHKNMLAWSMNECHARFQVVRRQQRCSDLAIDCSLGVPRALLELCACVLELRCLFGHHFELAFES